MVGKMMKKMKLCLILFLVMLFVVGLYKNSVKTRADFYSINNCYVDDVGLLYNFDESPDYIYIDFYGENGYVIMSNGTYEWLEFSRYGSFPYDNKNLKNIMEDQINILLKMIVLLLI